MAAIDRPMIMARFGAARIGETAGPGPRQQRRGELAADRDADDQIAHAERVVQMQRQYRQRQPDGEEADKHRQRDRQHLEENVVLRRQKAAEEW